MFLAQLTAKLATLTFVFSAFKATSILKEAVSLIAPQLHSLIKDPVLVAQAIA